MESSIEQDSERPVTVHDAAVASLLAATGLSDTHLKHLHLGQGSENSFSFPASFNRSRTYLPMAVVWYHLFRSSTVGGVGGVSERFVGNLMGEFMSQLDIITLTSSPHSHPRGLSELSLHS